MAISTASRAARKGSGREGSRGDSAARAAVALFRRG
jgi:hypothetical protein